MMSSMDKVTGPGDGSQGPGEPYWRKRQVHRRSPTPDPNPGVLQPGSIW